MDVAERLAWALVAGFDRHYRLFRAASAAASERFEAGAWAATQAAVKERIRFYDDRVRETVARLRDEFEADFLDDSVWARAKLHYIGLLVEHKQPELAETFFNSVTTRILGRTYLDNELMFVRPAVSTEHIRSEKPTYRSYYPAGDLRPTFLRLLRDVGWRRPYADLERDVRLVAAAVEERLPARAPGTNFQVQVLGSPFYRNKGAYLVGKVSDGDDELPFALAVLHDAAGRLEVDAVLLDAQGISVLFSLSRSYFMVDMEVPSAYVQFLQGLMPTKPRSELYTALGLAKQGKTLFFRDLLHHLDHSEDRFVEAPGTRGQVMHVFTLPSYPYVFKLIRDRFGPAKDTDRETVMRKFLMAREVDRVGRMVDALEFVDLALPLERFTPQLLGELDEVAPSAVAREGGRLIVRHCYVERRMRPLNLFLETATPEEVEHAVREYGNAIRELAVANVFPGDLLWRNFGLTRYGRVVFYDYDELEYVTDCTFRAIPPPPDPEAELADEPWFAVGPHDVFPEEFEAFLLGNERIGEPFRRHHAELLRPEFWQECQRRIRAGELVDFFPYPESARLRTAAERSTRPPERAARVRPLDGGRSPRSRSAIDG